jgi:hypothetical protein
MKLDAIGLGSIADLVKSGIDRIWPDKTKALELKAEVDKAIADGRTKELELEFDAAKQQMMVNALEAQHPSLFVSGWRPFIGWTCGAIFAYNYIVYQVLKFLLVVFHWQGDTSSLPVLAIGEVMPVLLGILGLGAMRSAEKIKGAEGNR